MALTNFSLDLGAAAPVVAATTSTPLRVDLDDLLYSPEEHQAEYAPSYSGNEPFEPPQGQARRPKVRKRAGPTYLPPPNQYTQYPRQDVPRNPFNSQLHTQVYQNTRLDITLGNQRVQEINSHYDNAGQYVHDPAGDYDYGQRNKKGPPTLNPGYAEPYPPATTPGPTSSRKFDNPNQNFNYNYNPIAPPTSTPSPKPANPQTPPDRPRGFTKVEANSPGGKTQLHAILDYDDDYYEDDNESDSGGPAVTPLQGPIFVRNGSVPVVPLTSYPTVNNGSFYQIPILWTALSLALGYELQGQIIRGVPCVKRNFQLYCPTAGNTYPLDKIENFIDENKALIKRMYGSFTTPGGSRVRRAPGVPDLHTGDSFFRHVRQARQASKSLPDAQSRVR
ncbi:protein spaetzle 3 isoform X2 [Aricia agestis]|uniref:protein spaetzle 3 isoform X2 n=1 Tax=Aricia agestis TaxID=91739 RepID=UPI001C206104|nr:protein spaetzle 3 isoform X2 [Aricia agestis]